MKLLVATRNDGKAREIRELFSGLPFQLVFPQEQFLERLPEEGDLEQGMSFAEAPPAAKHRVSHRGRAFRALIEVLLRRSK